MFALVPADHFIPQDDSHREIFALAERNTEMDHAIVTLGIKPTRPETGYCYIQADNNSDQKTKVLPVKAFVEKPPLEIAKEFLIADNVFWNSGIFIWKPSPPNKCRPRQSNFR